MNIGDQAVVTMITVFVTGLFGILLSLAMELIEPFAKWWGPLSSQRKKSIRGFSGLALAVVVVLFLHFAELYQFDFSSVPATMITVFSVLSGWVVFVLGSENTYQTFSIVFPRKVKENENQKELIVMEAQRLWAVGYRSGYYDSENKSEGECLEVAAGEFNRIIELLK